MALTKEYSFAAYLIDPRRIAKSLSATIFDNLDVNLILLLLKSNKVPLVTLDKEVWKTYPFLSRTPEFRAQYEQEHSLYTIQRNEWAKVKKQFMKAGIESMLIKSVGAFPYESSNLDVLIKQEKRGKAESILKDLGYIQLHNVEEPYKTLFRTFEGWESPSAIHLHNKVAWINPFHDEGLLWAHYRKSSDDDLVDIPSPEDSILILTAHWFYEDKELKLADIMKISACMKQHNLDWDYMMGIAKRMGWLCGFYFALLVQSFVEKKLFGESSIPESNLDEMQKGLPRWMCTYLNRTVYRRAILLPFKLPRVFGKSLHFIKTLKDETITPARKLYELYAVAYGALFVILFKNNKVNIRYQPPMLISLSGVDGSGKTTYAENISNILKFCELRTRFVWSRVGSSNFLKPFSKMSKILHRKRRGTKRLENFESYEDSEQRRKDLFRNSPILRKLGLFVLLLEMLLKYTFKIRLPLLLNKVVVCDRYVCDTIIDVATRYKVNLNTADGRLFTKILTALTPKPDIAYVLMTSIKDVCNRRKLASQFQRQVQEQIDFYRSVSSEYNLQQLNTDSNTSIIATSDTMIYEILIVYYAKWPKKRLQKSRP